MRTWSLLVAVCVFSTGTAQVWQGLYRPKGANAAAWSVNANHTLIWAGEAYLPRGLRIGCTVGEAQNAKRIGVSDVAVDMPVTGAPPTDVLAEMEKAGLHYLLAIDGLAPACKGIAVEPQGYRVDGISADQHIEFALPGCRTALVILVTKRDSSVESVKRIAVANDRFVYDAHPGNQLDHVLLVYPEVTSAVQPDYWQGFDRHRDSLLAMLRKANVGPGFRGIVNPLGRAVALQSSEERFVPTNAYFRDELRAFLEKEYKNLETAQRVWSMSMSDLQSFDQMARLVPLWSGTRGIAEMWDPDTDKLYRCDSKLSRAWHDITTVLLQAATRRYTSLVASIRKIVDVPVVQEWVGWSAFYETDPGSISGLAASVAGNDNTAIVEGAGRAASSLLRWNRPGWFLATDLRLGPAAQLEPLIDDLTSMGARGWFVRAKTPSGVTAVADLAKKLAGDASSAQWSPRALYYPENATNPATTQRLPAGRWWLPSPVKGNRIDLGSLYSAYRMDQAGAPTTVLWSSGPQARVRLRLLNPKGVVFASIDGSDPHPRVVKGGVEVEVGEYPLVITGTDEIPIPDPALQETVLRFDALLANAEMRHKDVTEERFFYKDNLAGFDRNPGGSYALLRGHFAHLARKLGSFTWIDAEAPKTTNFSEVSMIPGCAAGAALSLRVPAVTTPSGYYATYDIPVASEADQEVWVAARITPEQRSTIRLIIGGTMLSAQGEPVSAYSEGFAWYRFGTTRLSGRQTTIRLDVQPGEAADLAIDAIVLSPGSFRPNGVALPDAIAYPSLPTKGR